MAAYVGFYLNRGSVGGIQVIPAASIDRMETPTRTWAAQQGLKAGYGLSNYITVQDGFVYHGHNGGVNGGLTDMSYMPEFGVGYFYSINSGNGAAFGKLGEAIRAYITRGLAKPAVPAAGALPRQAHEYAGWYRPDSPRNQLSAFLERLMGISLVRFKDGKMVMSSLGELDQTFVPVEGAQFRAVAKKGPPAPIATALLFAPRTGGRFVQVGGGQYTLRHISTLLAVSEVALVAWFLLAVASILLYAPFWIIGGLFKKRRRPAERAMRLWPLLAVLSLLAFVAIFAVAGNDAIAQLGNRTVDSVGLCLTTLLYAVASLGSAVALWVARKQEIRRWVRWFSIAVTLGLLIAAAYLAWWGVIGIRTWS
jgi:hypothetical protein